MRRMSTGVGDRSGGGGVHVGGLASGSSLGCVRAVSKLPSEESVPEPLPEPLEEGGGVGSRSEGGGVDPSEEGGGVEPSSEGGGDGGSCGRSIAGPLVLPKRRHRQYQMVSRKIKYSSRERLSRLA